MSFFDAIYDAGLVGNRSGKVGQMVQEMRRDFVKEYGDIYTEYQHTFNFAKGWMEANLNTYMAKHGVTRQEYNAFRAES